MLYKLQICFIINSVNILAKSFDNPVVIKMDPDKIVDTLNYMMNSNYVQKLASDFAKNAVNHVLIESNEKEQQLLEVRSTPAPTPARPNIVPQAKAQYPDSTLDGIALLTERDAYTLIKEPSPDGDDLELEYKEFRDNSYVKFVPVMEVQRINGIYYRRLMGLIEHV